MNTLRKILIGLAGFTCVLAISSFVSLLALRVTIMDQAVVKGWLSTSKIYDGKLVSVIAEGVAGADVQNDPQQTNITPSPAELKTALSATFTPDFVQSQVENIIGNAYDWMDGKTPEFTFSIPVDQKRDALIQQLAQAIEPQVAALPVCESAGQFEQAACRPPGVTVEQLSNQVTTQGVENAGTFNAPITSASVAKDTQPDNSPLSHLPAIRAGIDALLYILPIVTVACVAFTIFATARERRLAVASRLSRRIFVSMLIIFIPSLIAIWLASGNDFGLSSSLSNPIAELILPVIKIAVVSISNKLALFSGIVCAVSLGAWIGFIVWQRKLRVLQAMQTPVLTPPVVPKAMPSPQPMNDLK